MVQIPGLGALPSSVSTKDVLMGAALGFAGTLLLKGLGGKYLAGKVPDALLKGSPLIGGLLVGGAAYAYQMKSNKSRGQSHLFGALLAGGAVQAWDVLKTQYPAGLGDVVSLKFGRNGYGVFVDETTPNVGPGGAAMNGLIIDEAGSSNSNLAQLAAYSMGDDADQSGMDSLMDIDEMS